MWHVMTRPCSNLNDGFIKPKPTVRLEYGLVITDVIIMS